MRRILLLGIALAGCGRTPSEPADGPGARLEAAARNAGMVASDDASLQGSWARDTDRLCVIDTEQGRSRVGVTIDYGAGQHCAASGTIRRSGGRSGASLAVDLGVCRFEARFDGDRITFPAALPDGCERACTGRATLDALVVDRLSSSRAEAITLRSADGTLLCGS